MQPVDNTTYIILATLVSGWCVLHSAMICMPVTDYLKRHLGPTFRYYRLFYNVVAILTLIPVVWFAYSIRTLPLFSWDGYLRMIQVSLIGISVLLFYLGALNYDAGQLLGLKQISKGTSETTISATGKLETSGILAITRHPWYLAVMLLIWARPLDVSAIVVNVILTVYLVAGTYLEEQKLLHEFGDTYRDYQNEVSMLIPFKWLRNISGKRGR